MTGYTYVFKSGGMGSAWVNKSGVHTAGVGDELKNSVVFTWGFLEVICWFWVSDPWEGPRSSCGFGVEGLIRRGRFMLL